jgi:protein-S-isoprenylcysteine O-methyltransferase Ste14
MASTSLVAALSLAVYISRLCFRRPNPPPLQKHEKDTLLRLAALPDLREYVFLGLALAHLIITSKFRPQPSFLCSRPSALNANYFTWTRYTKGWITAIYLAGALRLIAFRTLGNDFTFELAKPNKLVTSGVYRYMQHPSYLPDGIITLANIALFANGDGVVGTFLPEQLVHLWIRTKTIWLVSAGLFYAGVISVRIMEEEQMLRERFGSEWEEWHRQTPRFVPGIRFL